MESTAVRERPILFSAPMVRAILAGTKTQTRRIIKPQPAPWCETTWDYCGRAFCSDDEMREHLFHEVYGTKGTPYGALYEYGGDKLWVRETWAPNYAHLDFGKPHYRADLPENRDAAMTANHAFGLMQWKPSIHMPRKYSRILLEITEVRVQRLQEISEADAIAEGCESAVIEGWWPEGSVSVTAVEKYSRLWDSINGAGAWLNNPWVWAVSFKRLEPA